MNSIIQLQLNSYKENYIKHGNTPLGVFWNNVETQYERFNQLITPLLAYKSSDFSICDVGSGVCDLHKFLLSREIKHSYTGIEIVREMVEVAKKNYPEISVINQDLLVDDYQERFDFCVLSGTFNLLGKNDKNDFMQFIFRIIDKMYSISDVGIAFNTLTTYSTFNDPELFYLDPKITLDYIKKNLSRHCQIIMASPLYEDTYIIIKPEVVSMKYPAPEFDKYFKNIERK
jgi:hypothetical protein